MISPANIQIGPAALALDVYAAPLDAATQWRRRAFVGRMSMVDVDALVRARGGRIPETMSLAAFGEPAWPVMLVSIEVHAVAGPGVLSVRVEVERRVEPERRAVGA